MMSFLALAFDNPQHLRGFLNKRPFFHLRLRWISRLSEQTSLKSSLRHRSAATATVSARAHLAAAAAAAKMISSKHHSPPAEAGA
jgi:hypothetical protein